MAISTNCLNRPYGIVFSASGFLYVSTVGDSLIRVITPYGVISTLAGRGVDGLIDSIGTSAAFNAPMGLALDNAQAHLIVVDSDNQRRVGGRAYVARVFGGGGSLPHPPPLSLCRRIRLVNIASRATSTLVGGGGASFADGLGTVARFNAPRTVAVDSSGTIYVGDGGNHAVRVIKCAPFPSTSASATPIPSASPVPSPSPAVRCVSSTLAGAINAPGYNDAAYGTGSQFDAPGGLAVDPNAGRLVVADTGESAPSPFARPAPGGTSHTQPLRTLPSSCSCAHLTLSTTISPLLPGNNAIRVLTLSGFYTFTLSGRGVSGFLDGAPDEALFAGPLGVAIDASSYIYVADTGELCAPLKRRDGDAPMATPRILPRISTLLRPLPNRQQPHPRRGPPHRCNNHACWHGRCGRCEWGRTWEHIQRPNYASCGCHSAHAERCCLDYRQSKSAHSPSRCCHAHCGNACGWRLGIQWALA